MENTSAFKALSDKTRRDILTLLKEEGRLSAGDIASRFNMTQATVSHHLSILTSAGLIIDEKQGKYIYYEINTTVMQDMLAWFMSLLGGVSNEK
jgi:DNA-binding transcriptional ArsR family regulator